MFRLIARIACAAVLLEPGVAAAQTPAPPPHAAAKPAAKPDVKPAPRAPVHAAPLAKPPVVKPKPGVPNHRPASRPAAAPVPAPVPAPAPEPEPEKPPEPTKGSNSNLPLPRFASLRSEEVNMRTGPGTRYPIEWVYKRRDLPVQVTREFDVWRLVEDQEGVKGWVNQAVLAPRRSGVVVGGEQDLRAGASDTATPVARLKPGVIVRLRSCEANSEWCQASVGDYRGYIRRTALWGMLPGEIVQ